MKKTIKVSLIISLLLSNTLMANNIWKKYKPSSVSDIKNVYDKFKEQKDKYQSKKDNVGSAKWSLINKDCKFDPNLLFNDSMDRLQQKYKKVYKNILGDVKGFFTSYSSMRETCNTIATSKCIVGEMGKYINYTELNIEINKCVMDYSKGITDTDNQNSGGSNWVGCNVSPTEMTPSPPIVSYPYKVNSTNIYFPCPPDVPDYTPFRVPTNDITNTKKVDINNMKNSIQCQSIVWNKYQSKAFDSCLKVETKSCNSFLTQQSSLGITQGMKNLKIENTKCKLNKKFLDKEYKINENKRLENTRLPNNQIIKNGKVVVYDKEEKSLSFKPNKNNELEIKKNVLNTCKIILKSDNYDGEENRNNFNNVKEFCLDYKKSETDEEFVMEQLKLIKNDFYNNPKTNIAKFEILNTYMSDKNPISR